MRIDGIFSNTVAVLSKSVDLRAKNQNLIAANIANAETPNYVPKSLAFESELQGAIKSGNNSRNSPALTHSRHMPLRSGADSVNSVSGKVIETPAATPGKDGNAVELENEMSKIAENQIMFNLSVQLLAKKFDSLGSAIREGK